MYGQDGREAALPLYGSGYGDSGGYTGGGGGYGSYGGETGYGGGGRGRGCGRGGGGYGVGSQRGRGGYQGGDRGGRGGGRGGGRDGDWLCTNPSCGNSNFARRVECNKCGAPSPLGSGDRGTGSGGGYNRGDSGGGYGGNRGSRRDGSRGGYDSGRNTNYDGVRGGTYDSRSGGSRGASYGGKEEGEDGGYAQVPPPAPHSYGGGGAGNYPPAPNAYGGNPNYGIDAVPPPTSYTSGPTSYPPSYGGPAGGYGGLKDVRTGGRGGPSSGHRHQGGGYGGPLVDEPVKIKQCDGNCGDSCDNSRIYISNLPLDVTTEELRELFGGIGQVGRIKQKPWNIKIYTDEKGNQKGDAVLSYEDPQAAHSAGGFFNSCVMRGNTISVAMAEKTAPKDHGGGKGGYGGGGERRRGNYRDGSSGPDRRHFSGNRSRPY